ncbi:hypothetical protein Val02_10460 [Virgisporangium aliadipatigenens]|uniref:Uncharacterized protein n=1 Tax=Virgisporangium aliadipatigenens TaxID=741659 RepID=A0A8J3YHN3_9ACTN|nr:DUF5682 family protein [Virgisporangium aliadipatigenens]GIJ44160.1 hypothetical protein Val02_10460 [Virgisporangium aliadipatigenens]
MGPTFLGVRHHSPACAALVARVIDTLRPAHVLVEGGADLNGRIDELLLGHELPVAVFSSYRDGLRDGSREPMRHASWAPFCEYSPEWVALRAGRAVGAAVRFIDLPAWDPAFASRRNRYADAEVRYADVVARLCAEFAVDNVDTLWDHLFEAAPAEGLQERLAAYFDLVRGESDATEEDAAREEYMARWVRAAVADAGERPVVVVTGGFHRAALIRLCDPAASDPAPAVWPEIPTLPDGAVGGSYVVPFSFRRLDAFDGYQSGMPSPAYYQHLWDHGPEGAARELTRAVVERLRALRQPVSTADLIAARTAADGLALVRGHAVPSRVDILDGLASALVNEALDVPLPWTARGTLAPGTHPAVVEMVAALSGERVGRLHPDTPAPPLVHDVTALLERLGLDRAGPVDLDLTRPDGLERSRVLHRLRVLAVPGFARDSGPRTGVDPVLTERWRLSVHDGRTGALIEAGAYGAVLEEAAAAALADRIGAAGSDVDVIAAVLFDAALAGCAELSARLLEDVVRRVGSAPEPAALGRVLAVVLSLWRHDRLLGTAHSDTLGAVLAAGVTRALWLVEGVRGPGLPADPGRIGALVAVRDILVHCGLDDAVHSGSLAVADRVAADAGAPPDLRGAAFGFGWSLRGEASSVERAVRGAFAPASAGDWLAGVFALARERVLAAGGVLDVLDDLLAGLGEEDFLIALPALRQAFTWFPPRERETIAAHVVARHGGAPMSLRLPEPADLVAAGRALDARVDAVLTREGLL